MTQQQANFILATVSLAWGASYVFMKFGADSVSPFTIVALRSSIAFVVMAAIFYKRMIRVDARTLKYSAIVGAILCALFFAMLYGVIKTNASTTGFLMSTTVILVPILQAFITRKLPKKNTVLGVMIVAFGLGLLTIKAGFSFELGSLIGLSAALLYAIHIIVTNHFAHKVDALLLGIYQLGFAGVFATIGLFMFETPVLPHTTTSWFAILGLALICSAYGFVMQSIAQKYTTPENTGFLFSLEPIFSAIFAFIFLHENMGVQGYLGSCLILAGVFISNYTSSRSKRGALDQILSFSPLKKAKQ